MFLELLAALGLLIGAQCPADPNSPLKNMNTSRSWLYYLQISNFCPELLGVEFPCHPFWPINTGIMTIDSALGSKTINFTGVCLCVWGCAYVRWIVIRAMKGTVK